MECKILFLLSFFSNDTLCYFFFLCEMGIFLRIWIFHPLILLKLNLQLIMKLVVPGSF